MVVPIKLLNNNKLSNIMKKYCSVCEKLLVENHGQCLCKNLAK